MKRIFLLILINSTLYINAQETKKDSLNNTHIEIINGLSVEYYINDEDLNDENFYNRDNEIFKVGNIFIYKYKHISPDNETRLFKKIKDKEWEFTNIDDTLAIKNLTIEVADGNPLARYQPGFNQTNLIYKLKGDKFTISGVIENKANIWMHPPREDYFKILELNPYPFVKKPLKLNQKWNWRLEIDDSWQDERWKKWEGEIENFYEYEITNKEILDTKLGKLNCYVITSSAESRLGISYLTSFFNEKYGFVKLLYTNIDGSKTELELIDFKSNNKNLKE